MAIETEKLVIEKIKKRKLAIEKTLEKKIAYFQNKLEIANDFVDTEWLKMSLMNLEELKKLATSNEKEEIAVFISYLAKVKDEFGLELGRIESAMYGNCIYSIRHFAKLRLHLFLAMKSLIKFSYANCKSRYYYQRAFWQCGDDEFALDMLVSLKNGLAHDETPY